jgi:NTE family protein
MSLRGEYSVAGNTPKKEATHRKATVVNATRIGPPTCALVLGGGGAVGVGWQTGLITGLRTAGVDVGEANAIVGTSAGALVGALLASGRDVTDALTSLAALGKSFDPDRLARADGAFLSAMRQARLEPDARRALQALGRAAKVTGTLDEDAYLGLFSTLDNSAWPAGFRCPAIDIDTGDVAVWDETSDVSLVHAVASSCSVPVLFPTVTIKGRRYMDGGILSHLNTAAVPSTDVLVVLSCHALATKGTGGGSLLASVTPDGELAPLKQTRQLVAVEPDFGDLGPPVNMMDPSEAVSAFHIGRRQAAGEVTAIRAVWRF